MERISPKSVLITLATICLFVLVIGDDDCDECYTATAMAARFFLCGLIIAVGSVYLTRKYKTIERVIFNIESYPIIETNEVSSESPFSGYGIIKERKLLTAPYSKKKCVYYHSILEKLQSSGKNSKWVVVNNKLEYTMFDLVDKRGKLAVDLLQIDKDFSGHNMKHPHGLKEMQVYSEVDSEKVMVNRKRAYKSLGLSRGKYRVSEYVLVPNTKVYAFGYVTKNGAGELVLQEHPEYPLVISKKSQQDYVKEFYKGRKIIYYVHLFVLVGYLLSLFSLHYLIDFAPSILLILLTLVPMLILGSIIFTMYNRIIKLEERAANSLANIDVELRRRASLIPNLVLVVKKYAQYEKSIQEKMTGLRAKAVMSNTLKRGELHSNKAFIAVAEGYPDLRANKQFLQLMQNLTDTEERIAYSRAFYNRSVRKFNTLIQQFPFLLIAQMFKKAPKQFVNMRVEERAPVSVDM